MKKYKWHIILLNAVLLLAFFNWSVIAKERTLAQGKLVLLALAPIDPRSLMQGDYMRLRYAMARFDSIPAPEGHHGYCVVVLDSHHVAHKVRMQTGTQPLNADEVLIKYKTNHNWGINLGAESYFFQEGQAEKYAKAKYGGLRVDASGSTILTGLYDEQFNLLGK